MNTIKFNTGRTYSDAGQRIAAQQLDSGEIVVFDLDRHIDVILPFGVEFTQKEIMWAYDLNFYTFPSDIGMSYPDYYEIVGALRELASTVKPIN
jgi:hypothetical protein